MGKRILWLDLLKGFLILLVIFGHSTKEGSADVLILHVNNALSSIAMPGFMACSGYVYGITGGGVEFIDDLNN